MDTVRTGEIILRDTINHIMAKPERLDQETSHIDGEVRNFLGWCYYTIVGEGPYDQTVEYMQTVKEVLRIPWRQMYVLSNTRTTLSDLHAFAIRYIAQHEQKQYNADGFDSEGFDTAGFDKDGYGQDGFDVDGVNRGGYNRDGYNYLGFDEAGYDHNGYNAHGVNKNGTMLSWL